MQEMLGCTMTSAKGLSIKSDAEVRVAVQNTIRATYMNNTVTEDAERDACVKRNRVRIEAVRATTGRHVEDDNLDTVIRSMHFDRHIHRGHAWRSQQKTHIATDIGRCAWMARTNSRPRDFKGGGAPAQAVSTNGLRRAEGMVMRLYGPIVKPRTLEVAVAERVEAEARTLVTKVPLQKLNLSACHLGLTVLEAMAQNVLPEDQHLPLRKARRFMDALVWDCLLYTSPSPRDRG